MSTTPHDEFSPEERFSGAMTELHAATLAVLLHLDHHEVLDAATAYASHVIGRYDDETAQRLDDYEQLVENRAHRFADALRGSIYAEGLRRVGQAARYAAPGAASGAAHSLTGSLSRLSESTWSKLRRPFAFEEVQLVELQLDPAARRGTAHPVVDPEALRVRLDEVVGPAGWQIAFEHTSDGLVKASLTIAGAGREGFGRGPSLGAACADAMRSAARLFGLAYGLHGEAIVAVEVDEQGAVTNGAAIRQQMIEAGAIVA